MSAEISQISDAPELVGVVDIFLFLVGYGTRVLVLPILPIVTLFTASPVDLLV